MKCPVCGTMHQFESKSFRQCQAKANNDYGYYILRFLDIEEQNIPQEEKSKMEIARKKITDFSNYSESF